MRLSYLPLWEEEGSDERVEIDAEISRVHPDSSYNQAVIVLPDGQSLGAQSWFLLNYRVVEATEDERSEMDGIISNWQKMCGVEA